MYVHANVQVKNEALLLEDILPEWAEYPIDRFIFLDDYSTDGSEEVIFDILGPERAHVISGYTPMTFHEAKNRSAMLGFSRSSGADIVISLDVDELLTDPFIDYFDSIMTLALKHKVLTYQWNVVGSMRKVRQDNAYLANYRDFIFPVKLTKEYDLNQGRYHSPRTPPIDAPIKRLDDIHGFVHLQALNIRFYALKQLWYKTFEYVNYGKSVEEINAAYDPVVNNLEFNEIEIPGHVIGYDIVDPTVFDKLADQRRYVDYIKENSVPGLITFGEEFLK